MRGPHLSDLSLPLPLIPALESAAKYAALLFSFISPPQSFAPTFKRRERGQLRETKGGERAH